MGVSETRSRCLLAAALRDGLAVAMSGHSGGSKQASATLKEVLSLLSPERLDAISRSHLGARYLLDCLGEGTGIDPDPPFALTTVDCQTLLEQLMADAVTPALGRDGSRAAPRSLP